MNWFKKLVKRLKARRLLKSYEITLTLEMDERLHKLAKSLPVMPVIVGGKQLEYNGTKIFVNHHAQLLAYYARHGEKGIDLYLKQGKYKLFEPQLKIVK